MAQQQFYQPSRRRRDNDDEQQGVYDSESNPSRSSKVSDDAQGTLNDIDSVLKDAESGGFYNPEGESKQTPSAEDLQESEQSDDGNDGLYNADDKQKAGRGQKLRARFKSAAKNKKTWIGTGITGAVLGGGIFGLTWFTGPFEMVHIAQLLQGHFASLEDAGDGRMGKLYRFMRSGNDVGETRLTWLESKYHSRMVTQLKDVGLTPNYEKNSKIYKGFFVDSQDPKSPYYGMDNKEIQATLTEKYGSTAHQIRDGKFYVKTDDFFSQRKSLKLMTKELGYSKVTTAVRVRIMSRYGWVTWHPLQILDKKANQKIGDLYDKWRKAREERLKTGADPTSVDTKNATQEDENGKTTPVNGDIENPSSDTVKSTLNEIAASKSLKVTGGIAAAAGIVCVLKAVADNIGTIRYVQVVEPLIRVGMEAVTTGNQIMSGNDVDADTVSFVAKNFTETNANGKTVSTWDQAASMRAMEGETGGVDVDPATKSMLAGGIPSWLSWTQSGSLGALCSTAGQAVTTGISVVVGVISGGTISTIGGLVGGAIFGPTLINKVSDIVAGNGINVANAAGAEWGNYINFGSRLGANGMALQFGGTALSSTQEAVLTNSNLNTEQQTFDHQSLAHRLFAASDRRSMVGQLIDSSSSLKTTNIASWFGGITNVFGSIARAPTALLTGKTHAATKPYDYGFPAFGFSKADLDNPLVQDPYANAEAAGKILDGSKGQTYIDRAQDCFGVQITNGPDGWDVVPQNNKNSAGEDVNPYDDSYSDSTCISAGDTDWFRVRFFIFDTATMEGWACYQGDQTSCDNDGFGSSATTTADATTNGPPSADGWVWPVAKKDWSGPFGYNIWGNPYCSPDGSCGRHGGVDIGVGIGTTVLAAHDGKIVEKNNTGSTYGGGYIIKATGQDVWYAYQHMSEVPLKVGDMVTAGEVVGKSGCTGACEGPHVHFSVEKTQHISEYADNPKGTADADMTSYPPLCFLPSAGYNYGPYVNKSEIIGTPYCAKLLGN